MSVARDYPVRRAKLRVVPMAEPQHQGVSWGEIFGYLVALGWTGKNIPAFWGWVARYFESDAAKRAKREDAETAQRNKIEEEIKRRRDADDERIIKLYDRILADNKQEYDSRISENRETISALRAQVEDLHRLMSTLLYSVGQQEEKIDKVSRKADVVEQKANIAAVLSDPGLLHRIEQQAAEPITEEPKP